MVWHRGKVGKCIVHNLFPSREARVSKSSLGFSKPELERVGGGGASSVEEEEDRLWGLLGGGTPA